MRRAALAVSVAVALMACLIAMGTTTPTRTSHVGKPETALVAAAVSTTTLAPTTTEAPTTTAPEPTTTTAAPVPATTKAPRPAPATTAAPAPVPVTLAPTGVNHALLACIRAHEQGEAGYATDTGNTFYGAYQFDLPTWRSVGGTGNPALAAPAEQDARAWRLYQSRGLQPWPTPKRVCAHLEW